MDYLSYNQLKDAYEQAVRLNLDEEFISLLEQEIDRRNLQLHRDQ
ncbi:sporulation histidine kinase inhibitor Sda [Aquibacillus koreensis]|uniref:Sporulation histidine kinase inhibitor Sda n=1 Tax=Aquibacillus koreensis TaxID=279446 RepID=A0A9X3WQ98_9BACI|nr:sporulation histidine kinase inhibitor Sda [Aquibacillus koreensis]MCT2535466.1 sporulation histidine kinase inhibitor Sda [Aquibacillus koreensis]MDC3422301.1 sporulation histidine kinase inhibitor Sda [Aquibacillus koreensis]